MCSKRDDPLGFAAYAENGKAIILQCSLNVTEAHQRGSARARLYAKLSKITNNSGEMERAIVEASQSIRTRP